MKTSLSKVQHVSAAPMAGENNTILCINTSHNMRQSIWLNGNPISGTLPLFLFQISSISTVSLLIDICLKPLGQSSLVSQIFGGMIFGPTFLGNIKGVEDIIFPMISRETLNVFGTFGILFFFFATAVKMDPSHMYRPERKAAIIGSSALIVTFLSSAALVSLLKKLLTLNTRLENSLLLIASSQSFTGFPVVLTLLSELKILNTDVGRLAVSSSMFCDLIGVSLVAVSFSIGKSMSGSGSILDSIPAISAMVAFVVFSFVITRRRLLKTFYQNQESKSIDESCVTLIFLLVILSAFATEVLGQHYILGPMVIGLAVPDGPPLGAAISSRLDTFATTFFYPVYCALCGVETNAFSIDFQSFYVVGIIVIFAFAIKIMAVMLPAALFFGMPLRDAFVLGLVLNARGIVELTVLNLWRNDKLIEDQGFTLIMFSVVIVTAIITPMIRILYDPSEQFALVNKSTVHQSERDSELRILVCIHNYESLPTIMNILEVSHASEESPVAVTAMVLAELVGRSTPLLLPRQHRRGILLGENSTTTDHRVLNALSKYEDRNEGYVTIQLYTSASHFETMHHDICRIALDKRSNIVIVPFHKQWAIDGKIESTSHPIRNLNMNILEKAPCSVGILVDRGILSGFVSVVTPPTKFNVAVLFIGGPDDMESLSYGYRMVKHQSVYLTVIRFLLFGTENSKERKKDSNLINEYREVNKGNNRFVYVEETLRDAEELASYITRTVDSYNLILVGRYHQNSPLLEGLQEWNECQELGVIGDLLASPDFRSTATVLVIQQHKLGGKLQNHNLPLTERRRNLSFPEDEIPMKMYNQGILRNISFSISVDDDDLDMY